MRHKLFFVSLAIFQSHGESLDLLYSCAYDKLGMSLISSLGLKELKKVWRTLPLYFHLGPSNCNVQCICDQYVLSFNGICTKVQRKQLSISRTVWLDILKLCLFIWLMQMISISIYYSRLLLFAMYLLWFYLIKKNCIFIAQYSRQFFPRIQPAHFHKFSVTVSRSGSNV